MSIIERVAEALDRMEAEGRKPARLLLGHREAAEVEEVFCRNTGARVRVVWERAVLFGVPIQRVDQDSLLGVIAEGYEP